MSLASSSALCASPRTVPWSPPCAAPRRRSDISLASPCQRTTRGGEVLFNHILDTTTQWTFRIDDNFQRIQAGLADFVVFRDTRRPGAGSREEEDGAAASGGWRMTSTSPSHSQTAEGMSRYLSSQYLADSSLSQDALGVFAPDRRALPAIDEGSQGSDGRRSDVAEGKAEVQPSTTPSPTEELLDLDIVLAQPAMPILLSLIQHLHGLLW